MFVSFRRTSARTAAVLATSAAIAAFGTAPAHAAGEHEHTPITAPSPSDPRFMAGTTGPVVVKGTAVTVIVPDGPGVDGETGRMQNDGDRRQNNYSVTDANFNNELGLLPAHPDTGRPLTYVEHIQTYAAAGFLEVFAPQAYDHLVMHQNRGEGTVLGGASYLVGLFRSYDAAAHGVDATAIPQTVPGSPMLARHYVRSARDATRQDWARMHHAQTAPKVYRMLVDAGVNWSTAMVLAGDDGISGAGRLNGQNNQSGTTGMNDDERAVWSLAAQVQKQTGIPVISHLMMGHDHATLHSTALTSPRINALIGFPSDDRSGSPERVQAVYEALLDGRVGDETRAGNAKFYLQNEFFLKNDTDMDVDLDWPDYMRATGTTLVLTGKVDNDGVHLAHGTRFALTLPPQMTLVSATIGGRACPGGSCDLGSFGYDEERPLRIEVKLRGYGQVALSASVSTTTLEDSKANNIETRKYAVTTGSSLTGRQSTSRGRVLRCGSPKRQCVIRRGRHHYMSGRLAPASDGGNRWMRTVYYKRTRTGRWVKRFEAWTQVSSTGHYRVRGGSWSLSRGRWRVQAHADDTWLTGEALSRYQYLRVR